MGALVGGVPAQPALQTDMHRHHHHSTHMYNNWLALHITHSKHARLSPIPELLLCSTIAHFHTYTRIKFYEIDPTWLKKPCHSLSFVFCFLFVIKLLHLSQIIFSLKREKHYFSYHNLDFLPTHQNQSASSSLLSM